MFNTIHGNPFFIKSGQLRVTEYRHNVGWYNKEGEKLGWGDLSRRDVTCISERIGNDVFIIISEQASFWNFVTKIGNTGDDSEVSTDERNPGIPYVIENCDMIIKKNTVYRVTGVITEPRVDEFGTQWENISRGQVESIIYG
jgi:hypothetical protein